MSQPDDDTGSQLPEQEDGGDASLIRWLLSLSVGERLAVLQAQADALARLRHAATGR